MNRSCPVIAASITSITETATDGTVTTLNALDYHLSADGTYITRLALSTSVNPKSGWTGLITITYVPSDLNKRNRAIAQLVELDLAFRPGAKSENVGSDQSRTMEDYDKARAKIVSQVQSRWMS